MAKQLSAALRLCFLFVLTRALPPRLMQAGTIFTLDLCVVIVVTFAPP